MPAKPASQVQLRDFPGIVNNMDPLDLPAGAAQIQVNLTCIQTAELTLRAGYREVTFDND